MHIANGSLQEADKEASDQCGPYREMQMQQQVPVAILVARFVEIRTP